MTCTAVIPARRAERTIAATLASLRLGNSCAVERVLVVTSAGDPTEDVVRAWSRCDPRVQLVLLPEPASAGAARNAGRLAASRWRSVSQSRPGSSSEPRFDDASNSVLLFVDADCTLEAGGAARLLVEMERRGASVLSARVLTRGGLVAKTRHLLEFKEAASRRPPPPAWLPPSTTMLCHAQAFDRVGGFADLWPGEDLLFSQSLRDLGFDVSRSDEVVTMHEHPAGVFEMLRHQVRLGRTSAIARRLLPMAGSVFSRRPLLAACLLPGRLFRIATWQIGEGGAAFAHFLLLLPWLIAGLIAWTVGFVAGTRAGLASTSASASISASTSASTSVSTSMSARPPLAGRTVSAA